MSRNNFASKLLLTARQIQIENVLCGYLKLKSAKKSLKSKKMSVIYSILRAALIADNNCLITLPHFPSGPLNGRH
jgi:hypothetical protein